MAAPKVAELRLGRPGLQRLTHASPEQHRHIRDLLSEEVVAVRLRNDFDAAVVQGLPDA
jgi:hypothetical protein